MRNLTLVIAAAVLLFLKPTFVYARPKYKVTKIEEYGVQVNIGLCGSMMEGSRSSIRWLSRLSKRYPKLSYYSVTWTLPTSQLETTYDRSHGNVSRQVYSEDVRFSDKWTYGLDEVTESDLHIVAHNRGSFSDLEKRVPIRNEKQTQTDWTPLLVPRRRTNK